ncbi:TPA: DUF4365 domain-containing protein [Vibrio vulnificus]|nr:DUF4365 domain-containing protein [Vibrio vulnificus]HDY7901572.1 DUF4365 domain-containing protein [Vibrio vulnificus]HDY7942600.1 DUF4365 domain-containing protein [Vibrio vulnificus]
MPTRTYTHIIDTKAIKKVLNSLPDTWVVRELTERDYGTDLQVEIFRENGVDANKKKKYETTGCLLNLQVKGKDNTLSVSRNDTVDFSFHKRNLLHFERFSVPFILIYVDVSDPQSDTYFVWLQKYIKMKLDIDFPNWRTDEKKPNDKQEKVEPNYKVEIPLGNTLTDNLEKLKKIGSQAKFAEESLEFMEVFGSMKTVMEDVDSGHIIPDDDLYEDLANKALRLSRLSTLMEYNASSVTSDLLKSLNVFFVGYKSTHNYSSGSMMSFQGISELKSLLDTELTTLLLLEEFTGEMTGEFPY